MEIRDPDLFAANGELTVAIPTINSARYLDLILAFYRDHRIPVTVFVHDRSHDHTLDVAERWAPKVMTLTDPANFVAEGLIEQMSRNCSTKWMLRIDDDELPSLAMMRFVAKVISEDSSTVYNFQRRQCAVSHSGRLLDCTRISAFDHSQWRLYQPAKMSYVNGLHTPGFKVEGDLEQSHAPSEANMIHLDWAVHSYEDRKQKVERYDAHTPNQGTKWRGFYLYEEQSYSPADFSGLALPEFDKPSLAISRRFPELCVKD